MTVTRFLESPASSLRITEKQAVEEQGIAIVTCLLSGLQTLTRPYDDRSRNVQVAKGLHALHIYATEYWTEYLFRCAELLELDRSTSQLINLANELSQCLDSLTIHTHEEEVMANTSPQDPRLELLRDYPEIQKQARVALSARSLKHLEIQNPGKSPLTSTLFFPFQLTVGIAAVGANRESAEQGLEAILFSYQKTIIYLLSQEEYLGVSPQELEEFKRQFRASAYTCRFSSCPRATLGFESKKAWLEHEVAHLRRWACTVAGCQYPPFLSARALEAHKKEHDDISLGQKPIRRIRKMQELNSNFASISHKSLASTSYKPSQAHSRVPRASISTTNTATPAAPLWMPPDDMPSSQFGRVEAPAPIPGMPLADFVRPFPFHTKPFIFLSKYQHFSNHHNL